MKIFKSNLKSYPRLLFCYDGSVPKGKISLQNIVSKTINCWYILEGNVVFRGASSKEYQASKGDWVINAPDRKRSFSFSKNNHILSIAFYWFDPEFPIFPVVSEGLPLVVSGSSFPEFEISARTLIESIPSELNVKCNLLEILVRDALVRQNFNRFIVLWCELLEREKIFIGSRREGISTKAFLLRDLLDQEEGVGATDYVTLERELCLTRTKIDRLSKESFGMSPKVYRENRCFDSICRCLLETDESLKSIAFRYLFKDLSHFSHWFKRLSGGIRPRDYRQKSISI